MKSLFKIYRRYILSAGWIAAVVILVNMCVMMVVGTYFASQNRENPDNVGRRRIMEVSSHLNREKGGTPYLEEEGYKLLEDTGAAFAFLLNDSGNRIWNWQVPEEIPVHFTLGEVASFSRWYLKDYPVRVWNCEEGLLVIGESKGVVSKYMMEMSLSSIRKLPFFLIVMVLANLFMVLILAVLSGYRLYSSLRPVASGIDGLISGKRVLVPEQGLTGELGKKLNQAAAVLDRQRWNLEQRDTARTEWISGVSHDIRTPLSMVMGYADNLENKESLSEEDRRQAGIIKEQSLKIKNLIEDLNLTSKLEYQMQPLRMEEYVPAALLRSVAVSWLNGGFDEEYELEVSIREELESVVMQGDIGLLSRALNNLIGNSVRHNRSCRIEMSGELIAENGLSLCRIGVKDDGKGIPPEIRELLTQDQGYRDVQEQETGRMVGKPHVMGKPRVMEKSRVMEKPHIMGLRIVKQIVSAHGGRMDFSGDGREVILLLPVAGTLENLRSRKKRKWWEVLWYGEVKG